MHKGHNFSVCRHLTHVRIHFKRIYIYTPNLLIRAFQIIEPHPIISQVKFCIHRSHKNVPNNPKIFTVIAQKPERAPRGIPDFQGVLRSRHWVAPPAKCNRNGGKCQSCGTFYQVNPIRTIKYCANFSRQAGHDTCRTDVKGCSGIDNGGATGCTIWPRDPVVALDRNRTHDYFPVPLVRYGDVDEGVGGVVGGVRPTDYEFPAGGGAGVAREVKWEFARVDGTLRDHVVDHGSDAGGGCGNRGIPVQEIFHNSINLKIGIIIHLVFILYSFSLKSPLLDGLLNIPHVVSIGRKMKVNKIMHSLMNIKWIKILLILIHWQILNLFTHNHECMK